MTETRIILTIDMEACGKINMQASLRRNQNPRRRSPLELGEPATRHMWFVIRYAITRRYGFVGGSMKPLRRRNLVMALDTGRKPDKADRDHSERIVADE